MEKRFGKYISEEGLRHEGETTLLAVSGGVDSVVMAELYHRAGLPFAIAHCNFGLRGRESNEDERFVRKLAKIYGVSFFCKKFQIRKKGESVQMQARDLRYAWFEELIRQNKFPLTATAHHLDDQVETLLINLVRGTGMAGLHGILPRQEHLVRPLLFASRKEITAFARKHKLNYREDSSNLSPKYWRNRLRMEVIPALRSLNPSLERTIEANIRRFREAEALVKTSVDIFRREVIREENNDHIIDYWAIAPRPGLQLLLAEVLKPFGFPEEVAEKLAGLKKQKSGLLFRSASHDLFTARDKIVIRLRNETVPKKNKKTYTWKKGRLVLPNGLLEMRSLKSIPEKMPADPRVAMLDAGLLKKPLTVRFWEKGDAFRPLGMKGKKKLSDFFAENGIPRPDRDLIPLVFSGNDLVWVAGYRINDRYKITEKTTSIARLSWGTIGENP